MDLGDLKFNKVQDTAEFQSLMFYWPRQFEVLWSLVNITKTCMTLALRGGATVLKVFVSKASKHFFDTVRCMKRADR